MTILTVGIDLAKNVFALHGVNETGKPELLRPDTRRPEDGLCLAKSWAAGPARPARGSRRSGDLRSRAAPAHALRAEPALAERRGYWKAVVAIAAKNARMAWAMLQRGEAFALPA